MDPNILEISVMCSTEASATQFAQNHGLLLNDQSVQNTQQPIGKLNLLHIVNLTLIVYSFI